MESYNDAIICRECYEIFNEPVILPCGETICKEHVSMMFENSNNESNACDYCEEVHEIPKNGFPINKAIKLIIDSIKERFQTSSKHKIVLDECSELKYAIRDFENLLNNPGDFLHDYFMDLEYAVDIKREELKNRIDETSENILKSIKSFKKDCKTNLSQNKICEDFDADIGELDDTAYDSMVNIYNCVQDDEHLELIRKEVQRTKFEIKSKMNKLKSLLLMNRKSEYETCHIENKLTTELERMLRE